MKCSIETQMQKNPVLKHIIEVQKVAVNSEESNTSAIEEAKYYSDHGFNRLAVAKYKGTIPLHIVELAKVALILKCPNFQDQKIASREMHKWNKYLALIILASLSGICIATLGGIFSAIFLTLGCIIPLMVCFASYPTQPFEFSGIKIGKKYLVPLVPSNYLGELPKNIAEASFEAEQQARSGKYSSIEIWAVLSQKELLQSYEGVLQKIDPLLVARIRGHEDYVEVIGIWGNDLEALSTEVS